MGSDTQRGGGDLKTRTTEGRAASHDPGRRDLLCIEETKVDQKPDPGGGARSQVQEVHVVGIQAEPRERGAASK